MIYLLIQLIVVLLIAGLLFWAVGSIPGLPPVVLLVAKIIAVLIVVIWLAVTFLGSGPGPLSAPCHGRWC